MTFLIRTHDAWGIVDVGQFDSLDQARRVFSALCQDPWYRDDGTVKGIELLEQTQGSSRQLDWFSFV